MAHTTLLRGGSVFDGRTHLGPADVLVVDDRVAAVGSPGQVARAVEHLPVDEVVDCAGRLVSPGFVDAHVHAVQGGLERIRCDLSAGETAGEYVDTVAAWARAHPDLPWILGGGWAMAAFPVRLRSSGAR
jgi:predicted amidohydrolase YtcJ